MSIQQQLARMQQEWHEIIKAGGGQLQATLVIHPKQMCLITGCPRSGTSALLFWLREQKQITAFYESRILISAHHFFADVERFRTLDENKQIALGILRRLVYTYYEKTRLIYRKIVVEKEPLEPIAFPDKDYRKFLQNIRTIFPEIKLLFMLRNPVDTIWSMRQRSWGESLTIPESRAYSLEECIANWQACAELIGEYASIENVYICQFERLTTTPIEESHRILDFLSIHHVTTLFQSKPTQVCGFNKTEKEFILSETRPQREMLSKKLGGGLSK